MFASSIGILRLSYIILEAYYHRWVRVGNDGGVDSSVDCDGKICCNWGGGVVSNIGYE